MEPFQTASRALLRDGSATETNRARYSPDTCRQPGSLSRGRTRSDTQGSTARTRFAFWQACATAVSYLAPVVSRTLNSLTVSQLSSPLVSTVPLISAFLPFASLASFLPCSSFVTL